MQYAVISHPRGFVSICKYLLTAGLREQAFNVTQLWPGILKFSPKSTLEANKCEERAVARNGRHYLLPVHMELSCGPKSTGG